MSTARKIQNGETLNVTVSFSDSIRLVKKQVDWSPKGVSLLTKWPFALGAEVEFAFDHAGKKHCCVGIVVGCHPLQKPEGHYSTMIFFVETPCPELQQAACACRLHDENPGQKKRTKAGRGERSVLDIS